MSDEPALLAAIRAHPDEDTPRLIYADWLDENGQPERAEFIRLQCLREWDDYQDARTCELEDNWSGRWLANLGVPQLADARWEFRRGFPEFVDVTGEAFLQHYDAFVRVPWLRFVSLNELDNSAVRDLTSRPWPGRWIGMSLAESPRIHLFVSGYDSTPAVEALARCASTSQLRDLELWLFDLTDEGVRALISSPYLDCVRLHFRYIPRVPSQFGLLRERLGDRLVIGS